MHEVHGRRMLLVYACLILVPPLLGIGLALLEGERSLLWPLVGTAIAVVGTVAYTVRLRRAIEQAKGSE